ncbi:MAG TPA: DUF429 domain-containing protein [Alphaproteobacteria bacterium]|nr:DUF429 domain-containing protein [Alphaproteobacteria bacterium]
MIQGIDGYRGGWVAVRFERPDMKNFSVHHSNKLIDLIGGFSGITAIDMPIGLPEATGLGGRRCDAEVRQYLGDRQSSVFSVPARKAIYQSDYPSACAMALGHSDPPRKISKQIYHLFPKIRELDGLLPAGQTGIFEAHPEFSFVQCHGGKPLDLPKKIKGRPNPAGLAYRRKLLLDAGLPLALFRQLDELPKFIGMDDRIDAAAMAWTACRIKLGCAVFIPDKAPCDARGLSMAIAG